MPEPKLVINLAEGSASVRLSPATAQELLAFLFEFTDKIRQATTDRQSQSMEYRHIGDVFLEIFGNPNIWPSSFAAKVLITLRDDRIRLTTETLVTRLIEDVQQYLEAIAP